MDLVCFSHLRWNFVYQRPQHLLTRFSKHYRVFYIEEPIIEQRDSDFLQVNNPENNIWIVTPHLPEGSYNEDAIQNRQKLLLKSFFNDLNIQKYIFWYYTPMALGLGNAFQPEVIVYDCMDELSNFKFAPPILKTREKELFEKADIVFTGGHNLYKAKKNYHHNIHAFPSSIDKDHFEKARTNEKDPEDQKSIPHPRFGFYGVIDERMDIDLLKEVAEKRPNWHLVIIGPVVKIDPTTLPKHTNIHYLGGKNYNELPLYLSGWDVATIPFVLNESTEFISPTKTPEYLSGGKPVISTSIIDVVKPYGDEKLVHIADTADEFISSAEKELSVANKSAWLEKVDTFLASNSWDNTWEQMMDHIQEVLIKKNSNIHPNLKQKSYV
ncbi:MAG: glycosyltransferase family 1 protein [Ginsengibacter sp.]